MTLTPEWRNLIEVYSDWLSLTHRCVVIGVNQSCDLIDTYRSMIMRFTSPATRGFLSPLLPLSCLFATKENLWDLASTHPSITPSLGDLSTSAWAI